MRDGRVQRLVPKVDLPFGISHHLRDRPRRGYRVQSLDLRPGDRLIIVTDGMLDRNAKSLNLADLVVSTRELHPREASRALIGAVVDASGGRLRDDATVMCLDWHGSNHAHRDASTGADLSSASPPNP
jgi:serine/threonine protein phosphatase PrpC